MLIHTWISLIVATVYICLIVIFAIAIVMRRRPVGVSLAWLVLLFALPLAGMFAYLVLGSQRLGARRLIQAKELYSDYHKWRVQLSQFFFKPVERSVYSKTLQIVSTYRKYNGCAGFARKTNLNYTWIAMTS